MTIEPVTNNRRLNELFDELEHHIGRYDDSGFKKLALVQLESLRSIVKLADDEEYKKLVKSLDK